MVGKGISPMDRMAGTRIFIATARAIRPIPARIIDPLRLEIMTEAADRARSPTPIPTSPRVSSSQDRVDSIITAPERITIAPDRSIKPAAINGSLATAPILVALSSKYSIPASCPNMTVIAVKADVNRPESISEIPRIAKERIPTAAAILISASALRLAWMAPRASLRPPNTSLIESVKPPESPLSNIPLTPSTSFLIAKKMPATKPVLITSRTVWKLPVLNASLIVSQRPLKRLPIPTRMGDKKVRTPPRTLTIDLATLPTNSASFDRGLNRSMNIRMPSPMEIAPF